jgi:hypothetical protein
MSNSIPADDRELKIDELEMVSGGSGKALSFATDVMTGAMLGLGGIGLVQSVTNVVLRTAENLKQS